MNKPSLQISVKTLSNTLHNIIVSSLLFITLYSLLGCIPAAVIWWISPFVSTSFSLPIYIIFTFVLGFIGYFFITDFIEKKALKNDFNPEMLSFIVSRISATIMGILFLIFMVAVSNSQSIFSNCLKVNFAIFSIDILFTSGNELGNYELKEYDILLSENSWDAELSIKKASETLDILRRYSFDKSIKEKEAKHLLNNVCNSMNSSHIHPSGIVFTIIEDTRDAFSLYLDKKISYSDLSYKIDKYEFALSQFTKPTNINL